MERGGTQMSSKESIRSAIWIYHKKKIVLCTGFDHSRIKNFAHFKPIAALLKKNQNSFKKFCSFLYISEIYIYFRVKIRKTFLKTLKKNMEVGKKKTLLENWI